MAISSNFVNQAMLVLYQAKLFSSEFFVLDTLNQFIFTDEESANTKIILEVTSPPEFSVRGDRFSVAFINLNHYKMIYQKRRRNGEWGQGIEIDFSA